jgi:hypothetical protein
MDRSKGLEWTGVPIRENGLGTDLHDGTPDLLESRERWHPCRRDCPRATRRQGCRRSRIKASVTVEIVGERD